MNRDLFLAILSMDSYNRGYGKSLRNYRASLPNSLNCLWLLGLELQ
jgi:hypothetical protein